MLAALQLKHLALGIKTVTAEQHKWDNRVLKIEIGRRIPSSFILYDLLLDLWGHSRTTLVNEGYKALPAFIPGP